MNERNYVGELGRMSVYEGPGDTVIIESPGEVEEWEIDSAEFRALVTAWTSPGDYTTEGVLLDWLKDRPDAPEWLETGSALPKRYRVTLTRVEYQKAVIEVEAHDEEEAEEAALEEMTDDDWDTVNAEVGTSEIEEIIDG